MKKDLRASYRPLLRTLMLTLLGFSTISMAQETIDHALELIQSNLKKSALQPVNCSQLYGLQGQRYSCGFLAVPEDYSHQNSKRIKVPFLLIFPELKDFDPSLEPVLVTGGGGPGNALLGNRHYPLYDSSFWTYEEFSVSSGRVLVILENRGVGLSEPNLDCHYTADIYRNQYWQELLETDNQCGKVYQGKEVDLSQYNVFNAALDIEMLRRMLGTSGINTDRLNLYGVSYGTRVAMYYERLFPDSTRTLVLDSVSVNDPKGAADDLTHAQHALDKVFHLCRSDERCLERFGSELEQEFYAFLQNIEKRNVSIELNWPGNDQPISVPLTGSLVVDMLHSALYNSDTLAAIPLTISKTIEGSYTRLQTGLNDYLQSYATQYTFSDTAFLTYRCADSDYSTTPDAKPEHIKLYKYWDFDGGRMHMNRVCANYKINSTANLLQESYESDTPTLFLSGEFDPVTPPSTALKASENYTYYWNIVEKNIPHDVISHSYCARYLASWFVYHPQEDLDQRRSQCAPAGNISFLLY